MRNSRASRKRPLLTQQSVNGVVLSRLEMQDGGERCLVEALTIATQHEVQRFAFFPSLHEGVEIRAVNLGCIGQDRAVFQKETNRSELAKIDLLRYVARPIMQSESMKEIIPGAPLETLHSRWRGGKTGRSPEERLCESGHER